MTAHTTLIQGCVHSSLLLGTCRIPRYSLLPSPRLEVRVKGPQQHDWGDWGTARTALCFPQLFPGSISQAPARRPPRCAARAPSWLQPRADAQGSPGGPEPPRCLASPHQHGPFPCDFGGTSSLDMARIGLEEYKAFLVANLCGHVGINSHKAGYKKLRAGLCGLPFMYSQSSCAVVQGSRGDVFSTTQTVLAKPMLQYWLPSANDE